MREEEGLRPVIPSQLAEMAMKYWFKKLKNIIGVNKNLEDLKITANFSSINMPVLYEDMTKVSKIMSFNKRADKRLSDIEKVILK